ncbi:MBL fold metallo-hydrolase [Promicromonospora kroppenstedtii]|uniref:MBL fold metallo-hydrolase n=1 Tax=Promicromonospora kroppenstedtii TaxID=440482 RepID=A0ABW7XMS9_9MICO
MELRIVVAPVFGTNCCVVSAGTDCVVVDAGAGVADAVVRLVDDAGLTPRAVLATHGHADHTWDAGALCARYGIPMRLHEADAYRLDEPFATLSPALESALGLHRDDYRAPEVVEPFATPGGSTTLTFGAVTLHALHAPGHTEGSTLYRLDDEVVLSGDVLFAGSIGRTDLHGGSDRVMGETLRDVVRVLDPGLAVVPGHGPATTVAQELGTNPFLAAGRG